MIFILQMGELRLNEDNCLAPAHSFEPRSVCLQSRDSECPHYAACLVLDESQPESQYLREKVGGRKGDGDAEG